MLQNKRRSVMNRKVFVIDPGYSMQSAYERWRQGDFPGHALYGIQYFKKNNMEIVFQKVGTKVNEKNVQGRVQAELNTVIEFMKLKKNIGAVYIPLINYANLLCILKCCKIIKKPMVGLIHTTNYTKKTKHIMYTILFKALDRIIFINKGTFEKFTEDFPQFRNKAELVELMPENFDKMLLKNEFIKSNDFCSIGKTCRDFVTLEKAAKENNMSGVIIGQDKSTEIGNENISCQLNCSYLEAKEIYKKSKFNVVTLEERNGIFGLTSILDSFTNLIPLIVTKTKFMTLPIEKEGFGIEVEPYNIADLIKAMNKMENEDFRRKCVDNMAKKMQNYNQEIFSATICSCICKILAER